MSNVQHRLQPGKESTVTFSQPSKNRTTSEPEELTLSDTLNYYFVILMWRVKDPPGKDEADKESEEGVDQIKTNPSINTAAAARHLRVYHKKINAIPAFRG